MGGKIGQFFLRTKLYWGLIVLFAAGVVSSPVSSKGVNIFLTPGNLADVLRQVSNNGIVAVGMGYRSEDGGWIPGVSVFRRDDGRILRVADTSFSPGDDFCALWHLLDLFPEGAGEWSPRFRYR